ncbi:U6 snRNA-associated Sm-like protein LSm1 [Tetranychus urticae]|uniref:Sm domain-containing protein n=1 Tax=Tetranychus urticae TaxID=32264 RepID=T1JXE3_TETUR|nr:U6 snRNA-associated Sm-like protein LSm1 [Tetranychus urticae]
MEIRPRENSTNWVVHLRDFIGKTISILCRDGRIVLGHLRTIDNYVNLVITQTKERIYVENKYSDIQIGTIILRGENVIVCGLVEPSQERHCEFEEVPIDQLYDSGVPENVNLGKIAIARKRAKEGFAVSGFSEYFYGF